MATLCRTLGAIAILGRSTMANDRPTLEVEERPEKGSRSVRRLRRAGYVPGVVYGGEGDCQSFKVGTRELRAALVAGSAVLDLKVSGAAVRPVIVKDQQNHPVRGQIMHLDLLEVNLLEKIHAPVRVDLTGAEEAPGVSEGGIISQETNELNIEALPTDIPEVITVDVSHLEAAGTLHLSEITPPEGVTFLDDPEETIIATVTVPTEVPEEPEIEEETALVGEDGEPIAAAEGEEGEAAAEGESAESGSGDSDES
jgi:large subunit ribosomal protein L25